MEMEQKEKRKKDPRPLYKRGWFMILCLVLVLLLLFCGTVYATVNLGRKNARSSPKPTAAETVAPEAENTPLPNFHALGWDPDTAKLQLPADVLEANRDILSREYWVDITPENETGIQLFRHVSLGWTYIAFPDGRYVRLGEGTGGVLHALCTDLDLDGQEELLYTYAGEMNDQPCAKVGWLSLATLEEKEGAFTLQNGTLALLEQEGRVYLYRAEKHETDSLGFYELTCTQRLGELLEQSGKLLLLLD